jgi:hypothetical protein
MSDEIASELELVLEDGEVVLWSGRPHYPYFRSEAWAAFVFGLIALGATSVALFILVLVVRSALAGRFDLLLSLPIAVLPAAVFAWVAWSGLSAPWTVRCMLARALYAVTDRRVLVIRGIGYAQSAMAPPLTTEHYSFTPEQARARKVNKHRGGRVDLVLGVEVQSGGRRSLHVDVGILGAEDWAGAEAALAACGSR